MNRRTVRCVAAYLVAAVLLSGYAGLASHTEVRTGLDVTAGEDVRVRVVFPPPEPGATPEQIVRGFIRAGSTSDGDYDSARMFLTAGVGRTWVPDGEIVVFASDPALTVSTPRPDEVVVDGLAIASISADGHYTALPAGTTRTLDVRLSKVEGEWRISSLPADFGRWIAAAEMPRLVAPYAVHYVARDRRALVPDMRWFPLDHLSSRLARAQLDPVPADLNGVVESAIPPGTRLTADSVSVADGTATVDLDTRSPIDERAREDLWAQFAATLTQDPRTTAVVVMVAGALLELAGKPTSVHNPVEAGFPPVTHAAPPTPLVRRDDTLYFFDASAALSGLDPAQAANRVAPNYPKIPVDLVDLALSEDGSEIAALASGRRILTRWYDRIRHDVPPFGTDLSRPAYDRSGVLWVGAVPTPDSRSPQARLFVVPTDAAAGGTPGRSVSPVVVPWLEGRRVRQVLPSPDGERVAVLSLAQTREGSADADLRLDVAGVVRDGQGLPTSLAAPRRLGSSLAEARGLAWVSETSVATLGGPGGDAALQPMVLGMAGDEDVLPSVRDAITVVTTGGPRGLVALTSTDQVFTRVGVQWVPSGTGTDVLVGGG